MDRNKTSFDGQPWLKRVLITSFGGPVLHAPVRPTGLLFTATPTGESKWYAIKEYQTLNCIAEEITPNRRYQITRLKAVSDH
ncbi:hypothetical protein OUZ56_018599 [Daphnia magna]|uniref:Uncharacterized protein n=1 Tax=Daphnia magna TaxID=35525 RepID=A0ABQ9Z9A0_9CRUS|nr:hypothetical protein OUZ56_018599 [Daphnia magna]